MHKSLSSTPGHVLLTNAATLVRLVGLYCSCEYQVTVAHPGDKYPRNIKQLPRSNATNTMHGRRIRSQQQQGARTGMHLSACNFQSK
jgi:hypothetical protein